MTNRTTPLDSYDSSHWILIRGLAREARHWGVFPQEFQKAMSRDEATGPVRVDTIDLPGAGRYSEMKCPASVGRIAEFIREKYLEIRHRQREAGQEPARRTYLVAVSLGGMIACRWMERWPEDLAGCVLINTSFKEFSPFYRRLSPLSYRYFFGIARSRHDAVERETQVLKMVSNRPEIRDETAEEWAKIHMSRPVSYENFARQLLAASRFSPKLRVPPVPVLILNSLGDRMVHPSCSLHIAEKWRSELRRHPTAGHDLPLDAAPWVIDEINDWWKGQHVHADRKSAISRG